ncbi:MAG: histidine phosphatase family protein [Propionibacteriaceae bacterium]|jgi:2,3-bisphosphoglycerate-dependent phosphoglycerate mutase|nr:histidine phosphatase family protein [Propionibacteriaceae bacterium]
MHLLLIRHGESENNGIYRTTNGDLSKLVPDPDLTTLGRRQAEKLAAFFAAGKLPRPDVLYTSLMRRAVATSLSICETLKMSAIGQLDLHEVAVADDGPVGAPAPSTGQPASVLRTINPRLIVPDEATEDGWYRGSFETPATAWDRAQRFTSWLLDTYHGRDNCVALVGHGWFHQLILRVLVLHPPRPDGTLQSWFRMYNTATISLVLPGHFDQELADVLWMNRFDHLEPDELTV